LLRSFLRCLHRLPLSRAGEAIDWSALLGFRRRDKGGAPLPGELLTAPAGLVADPLLRQAEARAATTGLSPSTPAQDEHQGPLTRFLAVLKQALSWSLGWPWHVGLPFRWLGAGCTRSVVVACHRRGQRCARVEVEGLEDLVSATVLASAAGVCVVGLPLAQPAVIDASVATTTTVVPQADEEPAESAESASPLALAPPMAHPSEELVSASAATDAVFVSWADNNSGAAEWLPQMYTLVPEDGFTLGNGLNSSPAGEPHALTPPPAPESTPPLGGGDLPHTPSGGGAPASPPPEGSAGAGDAASGAGGRSASATAASESSAPTPTSAAMPTSANDTASSSPTSAATMPAAPVPSTNAPATNAPTGTATIPSTPPSSSALTAASNAATQAPLLFIPSSSSPGGASTFAASAQGYNATVSSSGMTLTVGSGTASTSTVDVQLLGSNAQAVLSTTASAGGGQGQAKAGVSSLGYANVYQGISVQYTATAQNQVEYSFVVAAGANVNQIRLGVSGAQSLTIDSQGDLVAHTQAGDVVQSAPVLSQDGHSIDGNFVLLAGNQVALHVGSYDPTQALTIDPIISNPDSYSLPHDTTLSVPAPGVLSNDTTTFGLPLSAVLVSGPSHGSLTFPGNGSFVDTPATHYTGSDSFSYYATDGTNNGNTTTVSLTITDNNAPLRWPTVTASTRGRRSTSMPAAASSSTTAMPTRRTASRRCSSALRRTAV
jgi:hypothetical protein